MYQVKSGLFKGLRKCGTDETSALLTPLQVHVGAQKIRVAGL